MTEAQACGRDEFAGTLERAEALRLEFGDHAIERRELSRVTNQEAPQLFDKRTLRRIGMNTDGPKTCGPGRGRPELHRNPGNAEADERQACEAVGDKGDAVFAQRAQSVAVEAVARSGKQLRLEEVAAQDLHAACDAAALRVEVEAGKLGCAVQRNEASAVHGAVVVEPVQSDGRAGCLHAAQGFPEAAIRRRGREVSVAIGGYDGEDGPDAELVHQSAQAFPALCVHHRAEVVDAEQVLRGFGEIAHRIRRVLSPLQQAGGATSTRKAGMY
jgi:hypothetical protein